MSIIDNNKKLEKIINEIKLEHPDYTKIGWEPILRVYAESKILIIGQAPGIKTQEANNVFLDESGKRLREWLDVSEDTFYKSKMISVLPMDFYFPGKGKSGDLPPNKDIEKIWHPRILACMENVELTILLGAYSTKVYLNDKMKENLTETVKAFREYLPKYIPLIHPSPRNQIWISKNPWFKADLLPELQNIIKSILSWVSNLLLYTPRGMIVLSEKR